MTYNCGDGNAQGGCFLVAHVVGGLYLDITLDGDVIRKGTILMLSTITMINFSLKLPFFVMHILVSQVEKECSLTLRERGR